MVLRAGFNGTVGQSSAQIIDGSLKFDGSKSNRLTRTFGGAGNRTSWTWSCWTKRDLLTLSNRQVIFGGFSASNNTDWLEIGWDNSADHVYWTSNGVTSDGTAQRRDPASWYHFFSTYDGSNLRIYVNDRLDLDYSVTGNMGINVAGAHYIGQSPKNAEDRHLDGRLTQCYFIDGQALGPENFGFTDPLTGTWRPKKYTGSFTTTSSLDGTVWTSKHSGTVYGGSVANVFDNDLTNRAEINSSDSNNNHFTISSISLSSASSVGVYVSNSGSDVEVSVNDTVVGTIASGSITSSSQLFSFSFTETTVTSIKVRRVGSTSGWYLYGILVNSTQLIDGENVIAGVNSFYLPMDGNSPIGQDKSGNGNDFTPVNFGGSAGVDQATGALPILEGAGGAVANVATRIDAYAQGDPNNQLSRNYSINTTATGGFSGSYPKTNLFDGAAPADGNRAEAASNDDPINITFDPPITVSSTISLWSGKSSTKYQINNSGSYTTYSDAVGSYKDISHSGSLSNIKILHGSAGQAAGISAIKIDGTQLIDSGLVLALPLVGNKEDVVASINSAQTNVTVTNNGSVPFQTTQSNFYGGSAFFEDSSSDNLTFTNFGSRFEFTGDYTIEAWIYPTDSGAADGSIFVENSGSNYFAFNFDPGTQFNIYNNSSSPSWSPSTNLPPANKWSHIALVRSGSTQTIYVNGNSIATNTASGTHGYASPSFARIGGGASSGLDSYIQDLRVYKGVAKYTENFVPASTSPDFLPDTPSGVVGGSKLTKITDGAVAFDGSGDYLSVTGPGTLAANSNWCMECFFYCTGNSSGTYRIMSANESAQSSEYLLMRIRLGQYQFSTDNANSNTIDTAVFYKWTHMAFTKEGTTVRGFVDGRKIWETTDNNTVAITNLITGWGYSSEYFPGHISNARFVNGSSVYTADFTPPTAPLTNITNTYFLCCQSNTSSTQATVIPDLTNFPAPYSATARFGSYKEYTTVNKNATSGTTLPMSNPSHYGGKALDLGSGGFQITTVNSASEDFFMGMWVHFDTYGTSKQFGVDIAGNYVYFETLSNGAVKIRHTGDGGSTSSNTNLNDGNWHHVALSRTNDTLYGFVDGTAVVSDNGGTGGNSVAANSKFNFWGADNNFTSYNIDGQIIDAFIYIGKGVSSYTNPTAPLVGNDGTINHFSGFTDSDAYYISPCVDITGSEANSLDGFFIDKAGGSTGTATNFNPFNTNINTVRGQETGYCTFNVLRERSAGYNPTFSDGNLFMDGRGDGTGTLSASSGKFYYEVLIDTVTQTSQIYLGVQDAAYPGTERGWSTAQIAAIRDQGAFYGNGSTGTAVSYGAGDLMSFAFDTDNNKLYIAKNGVYMNGGNPSQGTGFTHSGISFVGGYTPIVSDGQTGQKFRANFGQKPFKFPPPDGFQPLNAANVRPSTVITHPDQYVDINLWTGNGSSQTISNLKFSPDLVFIKARQGNAYHVFFDTVRGPNMRLATSPSGAGQADEGANGVSAFGFNSFTVTDNNNGDYNVNGPSGGTYSGNGTYVGTAWKAGGNKNTFNVDDVGYTSFAASGTTAGTITPTATTIGTKQGFSIIRYNGAGTSTSATPSTIPHGLSQAPSFFIVKAISGDNAADDFFCYHQSLGASKRIRLNETNGADTQSNLWGNGTAPTSSVISINKGWYSANYTGHTHILYAWHDVPGLQKFGSYESNNSADGPFVELGFRPALLWVKEHSADGQSWHVIDNKRDTFNPVYRYVYINATNSEGGSASATGIDFLSNGFKIRNNDNAYNNASSSFIYMAWAEAPSFNLYGGQSNAR